MRYGRLKEIMCGSDFDKKAVRIDGGFLLFSELEDKKWLHNRKTFLSEEEVSRNSESSLVLSIEDRDLLKRINGFSKSCLSVINKKVLISLQFFVIATDIEVDSEDFSCVTSSVYLANSTDIKHLTLNINKTHKEFFSESIIKNDNVKCFSDKNSANFMHTAINCYLGSQTEKELILNPKKTEGRYMLLDSGMNIVCYSDSQEETENHISVCDGIDTVYLKEILGGYEEEISIKRICDSHFFKIYSCNALLGEKFLGILAGLYIHRD